MYTCMYTYIHAHTCTRHLYKWKKTCNTLQKRPANDCKRDVYIWKETWYICFHNIYTYTTYLFMYACMYTYILAHTCIYIIFVRLVVFIYILCKHTYKVSFHMFSSLLQSVAGLFYNILQVSFHLYRSLFIRAGSLLHRITILLSYVYMSLLQCITVLFSYLHISFPVCCLLNNVLQVSFHLYRSLSACAASLLQCVTRLLSHG